MTEIILSGQPKFWDAPPIKGRTEFKIIAYPEGHGDSVSINLRDFGIWEAFITVLILEILENKGLVVDLGSHVGYYSIMSAIKGHRVIAIDESEESMSMLKQSCELNSCKVDGHTLKVGRDKLPEINERVLLFKCDIEGNELIAIENYIHLFEDKLVDYAIIEVTPSWYDYKKLISLIQACGYSAYQIPDKSFKKRKEYGADPIGTIKKYCKEINVTHQADILFIK